MNNRIKKFIGDDLSSLKENHTQNKQKKCVVVVNSNKCVITLSYDGQLHQWRWSDGPEQGVDIGSDIVLPIHPLAAEAFIVMEIGHFVAALDINTEDVVFIDETGKMVDVIQFHPECLGKNNVDYEDKRKSLIHLYLQYVSGNNSLTEDMIFSAIERDVLRPFLTLVNV